MKGIAEMIGAIIAAALAFSLVLVAIAIFTFLFPPPCGSWLADKACSQQMEIPK